MLRPVLSPALFVFALLLAGCSASAPATRSAADFSPASIDSIAVVFARGDIEENGVFTDSRDESASRRAQEEVPRLMATYAPHFGVTLVDARDVGDLDPSLHADALLAFQTSIDAVRAENEAVGDLPYAEGRRAGRQPLASSVADEVQLLAEHTGCRYLLSVNVRGWGATGTERVSDAIAVAFGGVIGALAAGGPSDLTTIETAVVDAERGEVVWFSTRGVLLDPRNPEHLGALAQSAAFELFSGHFIPPHSFSPPIDEDAVVYLHDGDRIVGRVRGPEDLHFTVETRDGEQRVAIEDVRSVRSFTGTGKLFPRDR
jgi:hypothetical protein